MVTTLSSTPRTALINGDTVAVALVNGGSDHSERSSIAKTMATCVCSRRSQPCPRMFFRGHEVAIQGVVIGVLSEVLMKRAIVRGWPLPSEEPRNVAVQKTASPFIGPFTLCAVVTTALICSSR